MDAFVLSQVSIMISRKSKESKHLFMCCFIYCRIHETTLLYMIMLIY